MRRGRSRPKDRGRKSPNSTIITAAPTRANTNPGPLRRAPAIQAASRAVVTSRVAFTREIAGWMPARFSSRPATISAPWLPSAASCRASARGVLTSEAPAARSAAAATSTSSATAPDNQIIGVPLRSGPTPFFPWIPSLRPRPEFDDRNRSDATNRAPPSGPSPPGRSLPVLRPDASHSRGR